MATDLRQIVANLLAFYDLKGKTVVSVGAGGGQLIEYARPVAKVFAVDHDPAALEALAQRLKETGLEAKYDLIEGDFLAVSVKGDVVLFEFSLHEMPDPGAAIGHARTLAPDVVVMDHLPESKWAYYAGEEDKVRSGWDAVLESAVRRRASFSAAQRFEDYAELLARIESQGERSVQRIRAFKGQRNVVIRMPYGIVLV